MVVWPKLLELASCLCREITQSGLPEPCFCGVLPGSAIVGDLAGFGCDDGRNGMAWVRLVTSAPAGQGQQRGRCLPLLAFSVEVGIMRNIVIPDNGDLPDAAQFLADTQLQLADMAAMLRAICCYKDSGDEGDHEAMIGPYQPYGPMGGLLGGTMQVQLLED